MTFQKIFFVKPGGDTLPGQAPPGPGGAPPGPGDIAAFVSEFMLLNLKRNFGITFDAKNMILKRILMKHNQKSANRDWKLEVKNSDLVV